MRRERERERESADAIFRERNRRRPRDSRRRLLYITSLLILDGNASLNGGELRFFSSSDSSAVVGGRWLTFRRGHCRASGRLGVMTSDEVFLTAVECVILSMKSHCFTFECSVALFFVVSVIV